MTWFEPLSLGSFVKWFGAIGAAVLLLYILKLKRRKVQVPFGHLWTKVVQQRQSSSLLRSLKRIFSLLLQLALLFLISFALTEPQFSGCQYVDGDKPQRRHMVMLLDCSASMAAEADGGQRFQQALQRAKEIVTGLDEHDRMMLVLMDARVRPKTPFTNHKKLLLRELDSAGITDTATNFGQALSFAVRALRDKSKPLLVILSDFAFESSPKLQDLPVPVQTIAFGTEGENVGIVHLNVRPYLDDSLKYEFYIKIRNYSNRKLTGKLLTYAQFSDDDQGRLVTDPFLQDSVPITLEPNQTQTRIIENRTFPGDRVAVKLEIDQEDFRDVFARDDVAYAAVVKRNKVRVLLVQSRPNAFLQAGIEMRESVEWELIDSEEYADGKGDRFDLVVFDNFVPKKLPERGNFLYINPISKPPNRGPFEVLAEINEPAIGKVDRRHPLVRHVQLADLYIARALQLKVLPTDQMVVRTKGGNALIVARLQPKQDPRLKIVAWAFDITESYLPVRVAFPVLLVNTINWFFQQDNRVVPTYRTGHYLSVPVPWKLDRVRIARPDGGEQVVPVFEESVRIWGELSGFYHMSPESEGSDGPATYSFAANLGTSQEAEEARRAPRMQTQGQVAKLEKPPSSEWPFVGKSFWRALIIAALLLTTIEWFTYHRRLTV